jgi:SAM-dependent methyltransferase
MPVRTKSVELRVVRDDDPAANAAAAYNQAGDDYSAYADGDPEGLYIFNSPYAFGDRLIWQLIDEKLVERRTSGALSIDILDAGCGPGTWLRRIVVRAHELGFTRIVARGFDVAEEQIERARRSCRDLSALSHVDLTFETGDLLAPLPEADATVDLCFCLYGVLNHLPVASLPRIADEIARVTSRYFIATVRAVGSTPTIFVDSVVKARGFSLDHGRDECEIDLQDGRHLAFHCHLFGAAELRQLVVPHFQIEVLRGLDLFHNRFAPDRRWNPASVGTNRKFCQELVRLEETYSSDPNFIDRAAHLLVVARHE